MLLCKTRGDHSLPRNAFMLILLLLLPFGLSGFPVSVEGSRWRQSNTIKRASRSVRNLNTGESYSTIQEAIDAPETLDGHEIYVASGVYYEQVTVNKSLSLISENRSTTIIDGEGKGTVTRITADNVEVRDFTIRNGTNCLCTAFVCITPETLRLPEIAYGNVIGLVSKSNGRRTAPYKTTA